MFSKLIKYINDKISNSKKLNNIKSFDFEQNNNICFLDNLCIKYESIDRNDFYGPIYPASIDDIKAYFESNETYIQHRTNLKSLQSILEKKYMFGGDSNQAAHFEVPTGSKNAAARNGLTVFFKWKGDQKLATCEIEGNNNPNILYHVSVYDCSLVDLNNSGRGYWESRLYPNTNCGLTLIAFQLDNCEQVISLKDTINIEIVKFQGHDYYN